MSRTPLQRIVEAQYSGNDEPRVAKDGSDLPSARLVRTR